MKLRSLARTMRLVRLLVTITFGLCWFATSVPNATAATLTYQPGPSQGKDAWISSYYSYDSNYGVDNNQLRVGGWGDIYMTALYFDLNGLPANVSKVEVKLYCLPKASGDTSTAVPMSMYRLGGGAWTEDSLGWYDDTTYYPATLVSLPTPTQGAWYTIDITNYYQNWKSGAWANQGLWLAPTANNNRFNNFTSSDYANPTYRPKLVVTYTADSNFRLSFPLKNSSGQNLSPYTTLCVGMPDLDELKNQRVLSYNGIIGSVDPYDYLGNGEVMGYKKSDRGILSLPRLNYNDEVAPSGNYYLFYDNHSGHDYPQPLNTLVYAAADGFLAVGVNNTSPRSSDGLWRNKTTCSDINGSTGPSSQWDSYHAAYIVHQGGYTTWYVHLNSLDGAVLNQIKTDGFAKVVRGQPIGYVGHFGAGNRDHLHFGLKLNGQIRDPYGNGTTSTSNAHILWNVLP